MPDRQSTEGRFHDHIRTVKTPNQEFYRITRKNDQVVRDWILKRCRGKTVLDYCCGDGDFTIWLSSIADKVYGIDISKESIDRARRTRGTAFEPTFFVTDAEDMVEFFDNEFDYIVVNGALHHLDITRAYRELSRILKPDGQIICNEPLRYNPVFQTYRKLSPHLRTDWEARHILSKKDITLARTFFNKVEISKFFHLMTLLAIPFKPFLGLMEFIDSLILRIPGFKWLAWQIIFVLSEPKRG